MQRLICIIDFAHGIQCISEFAEDMIWDDMGHGYVLCFSRGPRWSMLSAERCSEEVPDHLNINESVVL